MRDYDQVTVHAYRVMDAWQICVRTHVQDGDGLGVWLPYGNYIVPASGLGFDRALLAISEALYNAVE